MTAIYILLSIFIILFLTAAIFTGIIRNNARKEIIETSLKTFEDVPIVLAGDEKITFINHLHK